MQTQKRQIRTSRGDFKGRQGQLLLVSSGRTTENDDAFAVLGRHQLHATGILEALGRLEPEGIDLVLLGSEFRQEERTLFLLEAQRRGSSSIRAGFGRYFTAIEGATLSFATGDSPWGLTYVSSEAPLFEAPFIGAQTGRQYAQPFPVTVPLYSASAQHPYTVDWAQYEPVKRANHRLATEGT